MKPKEFHIPPYKKIFIPFNGFTCGKKSGIIENEFLYKRYVLTVVVKAAEDGTIQRTGVNYGGMEPGFLRYFHQV
jgi:hypothetical protein